VKISLGNYIPRDSFVHHLDPRVKLLLMALGIGVCFHIDTLLGLGLFLGMCLCMTKLAAIPLRRLFSGLTPFLWLFVFTALLHVFMTPGKPLPLLPLATREGLNNGLRVGVQLVYAIWISTLMTLTTSPLDMVWALEWFMRPLKYLRVPVDEIALLVMLAIRFIPLLFEETDRILKAQKARGVDLETGGMLTKVKAFVPVIVPLLHGVFRRADDLAIALTLRGYVPGTKRSRMKENKARTSDIIALLSTAVVFLVFIWL
jgi:energy-coupling factor transport system permease protein